jgi:hypothetical protein
MTENKNIIKGDKFAEPKAVVKHGFYAVIDFKVKNKDGSTSTKSVIEEAFGTRLEAKRELEAVAKASGGVITHFGGFKN